MGLTKLTHSLTHINMFSRLKILHKGEVISTQVTGWCFALHICYTFMAKSVPDRKE